MMRQIFELISGLGMQAFESVKRHIQGLLDEIKGGNRAVQIKTALVIGYVIVGLVTVMVFIPPGELNEIGADVRIAKTEVVGGWYFLVSNRGDEDWTNIVLIMNRVFKFRWPSLQVGHKKAFFFHRFKDDKDRAPQKGLVVDTLRIECQRGVFERFFSKM